MRVSNKAGTLKGSEIIKLAGEINQKIKEGAKIYNLTIGDYDPSLFPVPVAFRDEIIKAYTENHTNYPPADGIPELRKAISGFLNQTQNLSYEPSEILVAGGGRPLIYAVYQTILNENEKVIYPVPSWNNNHYCHLSSSQRIEIQTLPENGFLPIASEIEPFIQDAAMIALCSPLNPTGTLYRKDQLEKICMLVINENRKREKNSVKPLYILYDQIYSLLTMNDYKHLDPVSLFPELRNVTVFVDGISKCLAATGVRVGWSMGPDHVISRMKSILGHVGAWAPKAEQVALSRFLMQTSVVNDYLVSLREKLKVRFDAIYEGFNEMKAKGYPVDIIAPEGAIYLTAQFRLTGMSYGQNTISSTEDITRFLINEAGIALVPFTAFGNEAGTDWFRISVGTLKTEEIPSMLGSLGSALSKLNSKAAH